MPTEPGTAPATALVFPGQGAQQPAMLAPFSAAPGFELHCDAASAGVGFDVRQLESQTLETLSGNLVSSTLAVLCGVLALALRPQAPPPLAVAGYSVGQWTALYAAGMLDAESLFELVALRARLMDETIASAAPSGMLAVIRLTRAALDGLCAEAAAAGVFLKLCNDNAPGQSTLGGTLDGLAFAERWLAAQQPQVVVRRLPVAGAWHSALLAPVVVSLRAAIATRPWRAPHCPVIDNTSGGWLPTEPGPLADALSRQVAQPVLWQQGVRTLVSAGVQHIVETGWGDVLTRFGFFIDRSVRHEAMASLPRPN